MTQPFATPKIEAAFAAFPQPAHETLLAMRELIFEIAATLPIDGVQESLKWGQPSYIGNKPNSGTPVRLGLTKAGDVAVLTHCQSTVMSDFQAICPRDLRFDDNRALLLDADTPPDPAVIAPLIRAALTYRL